MFGNRNCSQGDCFGRESRCFLELDDLIETKEVDDSVRRHNAMSQVVTKPASTAKNLARNKAVAKRSELLPALRTATIEEKAKLAALPCNLLQVKGLGDKGLNLARLSVPHFCTIVIILAFATAHWLFTSF